MKIIAPFKDGMLALPNGKKIEVKNSAFEVSFEEYKQYIFNDARFSVVKEEVKKEEPKEKKPTSKNKK